MFGHVTMHMHSGVATGGQGGKVPPLTAKISSLSKIGTNTGEMRKNWGKRGKIKKKRQKSGRFFHFTLLTDRAGYAAAYASARYFSPISRVKRSTGSHLGSQRSSHAIYTIFLAY